ncbi:WD40-repeat-containing domain protein [Suillus occidentalis]|nr:WD40-repeat-containing domain protein [Suillus occidentalis]
MHAISFSMYRHCLVGLQLTLILLSSTRSAKGKAYSCGFDSTVQTWDVESGVCINTINVPERPMLDIAEPPDGNVLLAASTDRTVSIFDLRVSSLSSSTGVMMHPATPSCIATSENGTHQVVTGSYDGVARLWDLRSTKGAVTSFKVWDRMKVLAGGLVWGCGGHWRRGWDGSLENRLGNPRFVKSATVRSWIEKISADGLGVRHPRTLKGSWFIKS